MLGFTTNISEGGMFMLTRRPLEPGARLEIEIQRDDVHFRVSAIAVHAVSTTPALQQVRPSGMGVRFREGGDLEALRELVRDA